MWLALMTLGAVSWSAPPVCPPASELQKRLSNVTSRVDARVREHPAGFELSVRIDDQERTLVLPTCTEALESTVFLVELSAQTQTNRRPLEISPAAVELRKAELAQEPVPEPPVKRFHMALVAGAEWAVLPSAVARLGMSLQLDVSWVRFVLDLRGAPPLRFDTFDAAVALLPIFDAQLGACHLFELGQLGLGPCLQGSLGLISANGVDLAVTRTQVFSVWTAGAGVRAALALTEALELQAFASARVGPEVRYFFGDDGATAMRSGAVGIDTGLGIGARW